MTIAGLTDVQGTLRQVLINGNICGGRITDDPKSEGDPNPTAFPYVEIGETISTNMALTGFVGGTEEITIWTVWSRYNGMKELKDIVEAIRATIDGKNINVSGRSTCNVYVLDETFRRESDGITRRCLIRVQIQHFG